MPNYSKIQLLFNTSKPKKLVQVYDLGLSLIL